MFVYVGAYTEPMGHAEGVSVFWFDVDTGALGHVQTLTGLESPGWLVSDPGRRVVYSANEAIEGTATSLARDPETGRLTILNTVATHGAHPCYASLDSTGRFLLVANYTEGNVAVLPIAADGRLDPASCVVQHEGSSVHPERQEKAHAHMIAPAPDGKFVLVTDLGMDQVLVYELEHETGQLVPNQRGPAFVAAEPGAGPRHFAFSPTGDTIYVLNELSGSLTSYDYDADTGALSARQTVSSLPGDFAGDNWCAHVVVAPDGRFVYGSNRGYHSIAIWAVDPETEELRPAGHQSTGGEWPRNFAIDPTGRWLLAANERSDTIVSFRRDPESGALSPTGMVTETPSPVAILFVGE